jgi:hypothetical protein
LVEDHHSRWQLTWKLTIHWLGNCHCSLVKDSFQIFVIWALFQRIENYCIY